MDLLDPKVTLDLKDIYSRNPMMPPHYVSNEASIQNSLVADGCNVYGNLEFSILFAGVTIGKNATINSSIIMPGAVIEDGAEVQFAIIAENTVVGKMQKSDKTPKKRKILTTGELLLSVQIPLSKKTQLSKQNHDRQRHGGGRQ